MSPKETAVITAISDHYADKTELDVHLISSDPHAELYLVECVRAIVKGCEVNALVRLSEHPIFGGQYRGKVIEDLAVAIEA